MQQPILVFTIIIIINLIKDIFQEKKPNHQNIKKSISYCFWLQNKKVMFKWSVIPYVLWKVLMWVNHCVLKVP